MQRSVKYPYRLKHIPLKMENPSKLRRPEMPIEVWETPPPTITGAKKWICQHMGGVMRNFADYRLRDSNGGGKVRKK
jgi:hypothetical protein